MKQINNLKVMNKQTQLKLLCCEIIFMAVIIVIFYFLAATIGNKTKTAINRQKLENKNIQICIENDGIPELWENWNNVIILKNCKKY